MFNRESVREGMTVRNLDGEKLGKVLSVRNDDFVIGKGMVFTQDYQVRYVDVRGLDSGDLILAIGRKRSESSADSAPMASREPLRTESAATAVPPVGRAVAAVASKRRAAEGWASEVTIPLYREDLEVVKKERAPSEAHIHKSVVQEERQVKVPLRHEKIRVERRDVSRTSSPDSSRHAFEEEDVVVPLRDEDVELRKRVVMDREVVIHKDAVEEERRVAQSVLREDLDVDEGANSRVKWSGPEGSTRH